MTTVSTKTRNRDPLTESMAANVTEQLVESVNGQSVYKNEKYPLSQNRTMRVNAPDDGRYVSKEEYWAIWYEYADVSYEWNNGCLEAKPLTTPIQFSLYLWFLLLLAEYKKAFQNVDIMGLETGFTMQVPDPNNPGTLKEVTRKPDIAVIRHSNPVQWGEEDRSYKGICNVCIEAVSDSAPSEIERDIITKFAEYEFAQVQEYFTLDPSGEHMGFSELSMAGAYVDLVPTADGVIRSKELPGFQFRVDDLYRRPPLEELARDEVYKHYVLLEYQEAEKRAKQAQERVLQVEKRVEEEQQRADEERQRANEEQQRAEKERQRSERYAAMLRELGISPDED